MEDIRSVRMNDEERDFMHLGVAQARRGWCTTDDVLNTKPLDEIRSFFEG